MNEKYLSCAYGYLQLFSLNCLVMPLPHFFINLLAFIELWGLRIKIQSYFRKFFGCKAPHYHSLVRWMIKYTYLVISEDSEHSFLWGSLMEKNYY